MITETNYFTKYAKSVVKKYEGMKEEYEFCKAYLTTFGQNPIVRTELTTNNEKDVWHDDQEKMMHDNLSGIDGQHSFGTINTLDFTDNKTYKAITIDNIKCNIVAEYEKYCWEVEINGKVKVILKSKIALI
jgi:hypothetical protein